MFRVKAKHLVRRFETPSGNPAPNEAAQVGKLGRKSLHYTIHTVHV